MTQCQLHWTLRAKASYTYTELSSMAQVTHYRREQPLLVSSGCCASNKGLSKIEKLISKEKNGE